MSESGAPEAPLFLMGPNPAALIAFGTALAGMVFSGGATSKNV